MSSSALRAVIVIGLAGLAVVLFLVLSGDDADQPEAPRGPADATVPEQPAAAQIVIRDGEPVGGVSRLTYTRGERVRLVVRSDTPGDVHVHGYELERDVAAGGTVRLDFQANLEGLFEVELHAHEAGADVPVAMLAVQPG